MKHDYDLIVLGLARWDNQYHSPALSIAKEFSKSNRVFFIDNPYSVKDYWSEKHLEQVEKRKPALLWGRNIYTHNKTEAFDYVAVTSRLNLPINFLPDGFLYETLYAFNTWILNLTIKRLIKDYNIKKYVFINSFNPFYLKDFNLPVKPLVKIYQSIDDISQESYIARHGVKLETEMVQNADFTIVTSSQLKDKLSKHANKVHLVANAADHKLFHRAVANHISRPEELDDVQCPIITYMGNVSSLRMDYELLVKVANANPDKLVLVVGPYRKNEYDQFQLYNFRNIRFIGPRTLEQLPVYLRYTDCAIIPYIKNTLTRSIYPLKINEYLGAGKPVVSTDFSEDIKTFQGIAHIASSHDEFLKMVQQALNQTEQDAIDKRLEVAANNTWFHRVNQIKALIEEALNNQGKS